jgi:hypothetical protein
MAAVSLASGCGVAYEDYGPIPFFFTDVPVYAEQGWSGFSRYGRMLGLVLLASTPAFAGTSPEVYTPLANRGIPAALVTTGSVLLTVVIVAAVARRATRTAIQRFRTYHLST